MSIVYIDKINIKLYNIQDMKKMFFTIVNLFLVFFGIKNTASGAITMFDIQPVQSSVYGFEPAEYLRFNFSFTLVSHTEDVFVSSVVYNGETFGATPQFEAISFSSAFLSDENGYIFLQKNTPTSLTFQGWVTVDRTDFVKVVVSGITISRDKISQEKVLFDTPLETQTRLLHVIPEPSQFTLIFVSLFGLLSRRLR